MWTKLIFTTVVKSKSYTTSKRQWDEGILTKDMTSVVTIHQTNLKYYLQSNYPVIFKCVSSSERQGKAEDLFQTERDSRLEVQCLFLAFLSKGPQWDSNVFWESLSRTVSVEVLIIKLWLFKKIRLLAVKVHESIWMWESPVTVNVSFFIVMPCLFCESGFCFFCFVGYFIKQEKKNSYL